jgi:lipocalin
MQASASDPDDPAPVTTVSFLDLECYVGSWFEIAKIPNRFQEQCASETTAEYALREDGKITVVNRCLEEDGSLDEAEGNRQDRRNRKQRKAQGQLRELPWLETVLGRLLGDRPGR